MAALAVTGASTIVGMAGAQAQAQGEQAAAQYSAQVKTQQANEALSASAENERRQRIQARNVIGGMRANIGASGVQTEGSAMDVLQSSASNAELDSLTIRHNGEMKAWALKAGASLDMLKGENAKIAGDYKAASYLLQGAGSAADSLG